MSDDNRLSRKLDTDPEPEFPPFEVDTDLEDTQPYEPVDVPPSMVEYNDEPYISRAAAMVMLGGMDDVAFEITVMHDVRKVWFASAPYYRQWDVERKRDILDDELLRLVASGLGRMFGGEW